MFGRTGGNDSVWLDLGYPTLVTPDGRRYKPLFAPLIVDLDGKINLNTAGNVRAGTQGQGSNQGLGPWEVSPMWVLNPSATSYPGPSGEWSYLINGRTTPVVIRGKYASSGIPNPSIGSASSIPIPHWYAAWDSDSVTTSGVITTRFSLPAGNNVFPIFPGLSTGTSGYDQTLNGEFTNNPMLYDLSRPWFGAWNLDALYRYGDTGSPWLGCDLFRLCPTSFSNARSRWQVTTHSYHRDSRPAITPRIDLNRALTPYPAPGANGQITDTTTFNQAQTDRQNLARDIFNALKKATGVSDTPTQRQLAQLAVNFVDYIDDDNYMTPFNWKGDGSEWLFGTEIPRVVLNEAYAEYTTGKVWAELLNTFAADLNTAARDYDGTAALDLNNGQIQPYRILITPPNASLRAPANLLGSPDNGFYYGTPVTTSSSVVIQPSSTTTGNATGNGYCLIGPSAVTGVSPTVTNTQMTFPQTTLTSSTAVAAAGTATITLTPAPTSTIATPATLISNVGNVGWPIADGTQLLIEPGTTNQELVTVTNGSVNTTNGTCTATFAKTHTAPFSFAVIPVPLTSSTLVNTAGTVTVNNFTPAPTTTSATPATLIGNGWSITAGSYLLIEPGSAMNQEVVSVQSVTTTPPTFTAAFAKTHTTSGFTFAVIPTPPTLLLQRLACPAMPFNDTPGPTYNPYVTVDYMENIPPWSNNETSRASVGRPQPYAGLSSLLVPQTNSIGYQFATGLAPSPWSTPPDRYYRRHPPGKLE